MAVRPSPRLRPRPNRSEIEDGWYHVISRGIERREIFRDDSDRTDFLERLFGLTESHAVLVHAHPARSLAIVLSRRHTALTLREIGERCGGSDYAAVSQAQHRMETKLRENMPLAAT